MSTSASPSTRSGETATVRSSVDVSYRALKVWQRNRDVFLHIWKAEMIWPIF